MHFHIITPTHNRLNLLQRNIKSVQEQDCLDFTQWIIDDSTNHETEVWMMENMPRNTQYIKNEKNIGSNASKNRALDVICSCQAEPQSYVIFLDDDDFLSSDALLHLAENMSDNQKWYITQRVYENGISITQVPSGKGIYNYVGDYLLGGRIQGDATHIIDTRIIEGTRFASDIKNGEEWIFFLQIAAKSSLYFLPLETTLTEGYLKDGLTHQRVNLSWRRRMMIRMYQMIGVLFPGVPRWKVYAGWIIYLPGIYNLYSFIKNL